MRSTQVLGVYPDLDEAQEAVERLEAAGFSEDEVAVLHTGGGRALQFGLNAQTKGPEGALFGGSLGSLVGGLILGIASVGTLTVPGTGTVLQGTWVSVLAGIGLGGSLCALAGGLIGRGVPEDEVRLVGAGTERGHALVGVVAPNTRRARRAREILAGAGALVVQRTTLPAP